MRSMVDIILDKTRIDALLASDSNVINYEPSSFFIIFQIRGRNLPMILLPLSALLAWDIFWAIAFSGPLQGIRDKIVSQDNLIIAPLLTPVSFLLVFRLGRAAVRFWDARAAAGKVVEICRVLVSTTSVMTPSCPSALKDEFARWICVFPVAVKNFLRPDTRDGWAEAAIVNKRRLEIGQLLPEKDAEAIIRPESGHFEPILVLNRLRGLAYEASLKAPQTMATGVYRQLNEEIDTLTGAWGAMERINSTPLPFVYVVHLRTFLMLYLCLWHLDSIARNGWISVFNLMIASWALLGLEAASVECERPFRWSTNHLPLGKMCVVVARNVAQTIKNVQY